MADFPILQCTLSEIHLGCWQVQYFVLSVKIIAGLLFYSIIEMMYRIHMNQMLSRAVCKDANQVQGQENYLLALQQFWK